MAYPASISPRRSSHSGNDQTLAAQDAAILRSVLNLARWAPSGDNSQPWRFEVKGARHVVVHGTDTRHASVYDFQGRASQLSLGALLENFRLAATMHGWLIDAKRRPGPITHPTFDLHFSPAGTRPDPLAGCIRSRSVQRGPMSTRPLSDSEKAALRSAVGPAYEVVWRTAPRDRWTMARLLFANARIRFLMPEAYGWHRRMIEWDARFSRDRIPDQALGASRPTLALMRWAMRSWNRVRFSGTWLAGTVLPRLEMEMLPAWACAGHFLIVARDGASNLGPEAFIDAGRAMQRFWLTATHLGLQLQPEVTPLIFSWYQRAGQRFSAEPGLQEQARILDGRFVDWLGRDDWRNAVFMGRIGNGPTPQARAVRLTLQELQADVHKRRGGGGDQPLPCGPSIDPTMRGPRSRPGILPSAMRNAIGPEAASTKKRVGYCLDKDLKIGAASHPSRRARGAR